MHLPTSKKQLPILPPGLAADDYLEQVNGDADRMLVVPKEQALHSRQHRAPERHLSGAFDQTYQCGEFPPYGATADFQRSPYQSLAMDLRTLVILVARARADKRESLPKG
jgi:hypothetical protein